jgi:ABC-2 type transport system ATP-binding protein
MANEVIKVKKLTKHYGKLTAVDGISFEVYKGEIFGLLGENGAGKTTTLEMIEGLRKPASGLIEVLGQNAASQLDEIKKKIGVQLQSSAYYSFLTLHEILSLFCSFYGSCVEVDELLAMVDLEKKAKSFINQLSGGQKQRFSIIASLVNDPEIVFLDEPTTGLDPIARRNLWKLITDIKKRGKTIILTTHYMEEAEALCDRVAIMDNGKILALDDTHKLVEKMPEPFSISFVTTKMDGEIKKLEKIGKVELLHGKEDNYRIKIKSQKHLLEALAIVQKISPESITVGRATLEDVFITLTGKRIEE